MTYDEAIQFLYDLQLFGAKFGLENTRRLAELAGSPHDRLKFIHVAGTNGKGSVCAMLESVYRAAGYRTGLHTSPHLVHFGERIRVNHQPLDNPAVISLVERMKRLLSEGADRGYWPHIGTREAESLGHPTFFEVVTVMAMMHFAEQNCEIVCWETGMGGRLDATNIVTPLASVITTISLEHCTYLGNTIEKIAAEKSGIIKPRVPVITAVEDQSALAIIEEVARSRNAPLTTVNRKTGSESARQFFPNSYQSLNAQLASTIVAELQSALPVEEERIAEGLRAFSFPGRLQTLKRERQTLLLDGAHNPASMRALRESISRNRVPVIFGCFADKDLDRLLIELLPMASELHLVPIDSPRSAGRDQLKKSADTISTDIPRTVHRSLRDALVALEGKPEVLVTGSLYLVGEALSILTQDDGRLTPEHTLNDWRASTR